MQYARVPNRTQIKQCIFGRAVIWTPTYFQVIFCFPNLVSGMDFELQHFHGKADFNLNPSKAKPWQKTSCAHALAKLLSLAPLAICIWLQLMTATPKSNSFRLHRETFLQNYFLAIGICKWGHKVLWYAAYTHTYNMEIAYTDYSIL